MRILILSLFVLSSIFASGQDEKSFNALDYKSVMIRLLDKVVFNTGQEALWKPNYSDKLSMPVSDDGFCHTTMDTTMYYHSGNTKYAVIILATYEYMQGERISCHVCAPILSIATFKKEVENNWQIIHFKKDFISFGAWGKMLGRLGIEKLGDDFYCLKAQSAVYGNQGYESGITTYYSLTEYEQFPEVFSYVYYDSNEGAMEEGQGTTENTIMKVIQTSKDFYVIELSSKRTDRKMNELKRFKYSEEERRYMPFIQ